MLPNVGGVGERMCRARAEPHDTMLRSTAGCSTMARMCSVCTHAEREAINAALVAGEPYRAIAQRFASSPDAVFRHKRDHLAGLLAKAAQAKDAAGVAEGASLLDQLRAL